MKRQQARYDATPWMRKGASSQPAVITAASAPVIAPPPPASSPAATKPATPTAPDPRKK